MGSPGSEKGRSADEGPQHLVNIVRPFALMRCEVTVGAFRLFAEQTLYKTDAERSGKGCGTWDSSKGSWARVAGTSWRNPRFPGVDQQDNHPVVCVSWNDASAFAAWLSLQTGQAYRLPTEAEWEYAARAGSSGARYWDGKASPCDFANGADRALRDHSPVRDVVKGWSFLDCSDGYPFTAPVGSYKPNDFGLDDMLGNVWEWTQDCWHGDYTGAPNDGTAWQEQDGGDCTRRVARGGGWIVEPELLRSANRSRLPSDVASRFLGFRLARTL